MENATTLQWVHLIPAGTSTGRDGRGPYTLNAAAVLAAFAAHKADLPVDYEHQSLSAVQKSGPVPAAGWIKALESRPDGLWGHVEWTAQAAELLGSKKYRYLSPVINYLPSGEVISISGAGLVHAPNLLLQAAAGQQAPNPTNPTLITATHGELMDLDYLMERLRSLLNLPTLATADELIAEIEKLKTAITAANTALASQNAAMAELQTAAQAAQAAVPDPTQFVPIAQHSAIMAQLSGLQAAQAQAQAQELVSAAMSAGKVSPAVKDWALAYAAKDPAGFASYVGAAPVIVVQGAMATQSQAAALDLTDPQAIADAATAYQTDAQSKGIEVSHAQAVAVVAARRNGNAA